MTIKQQLQNDMKEAMRNKDKAALTTIRMIVDRIQKREKDLLRDLSEDEVVQVIQTFNKQVKEEAEAFAKAGKFSREAELVDCIVLIEKYLPEQMSQQEITFLVIAICIKFMGKGEKINKGTIMKELMPLIKGKADNKMVNEIVTNLLA